jgi:putative addiction module component (TIGR02574 family)
MSKAELIEQALKLEAADRLMLVELLHESLDKPDPEIDRIWAEEAQRRLAAYRSGKLGGTDMATVFGRL